MIPYPPQRVLVADDHPPTRTAIRAALEDGGGFEVCAMARDAPEAVALAIETRPDLCLLDVLMPGNGIAACWEISARLPVTRVVMLSVSEDETDVFTALRAGAMGYLLKDADPAHLPRALRSVLRGEIAIPRVLVGRMVEAIRDPSARRRVPLDDDASPHLTSREWQILDLLRRGLTTTQIARRLVVSPVTVRTHVRALRRKLGFTDRAMLERHFDRR